MATRIIEYNKSERNDAMQAVPFHSVVQSTITASGTAQSSAAFGPDTTMICVQSDEPVHVTRTLPTNSVVATTSNYKIPAGQEQFFTVNPGQIVSILLGT